MEDNFFHVIKSQFELVNKSSCCCFDSRKFIHLIHYKDIEFRTLLIIAVFIDFFRNFAKRQMTWFRNELIYQWLDASQPLVSHFLLFSINLSGR